MAIPMGLTPWLSCTELVFVGVQRLFVTVMDISRPCQPEKLIPLLPWPHGACENGPIQYLLSNYFDKKIYIKKLFTQCGSLIANCKFLIRKIMYYENLRLWAYTWKKSVAFGNVCKCDSDLENPWEELHFKIIIQPSPMAERSEA